MTMEYKSFGSIYKMEDKEGISYIKGHASAFGNVDSHGDIVEKGAFKRSIEDAKKRKINLFSSHSMDARDLVGSITSMREDGKGLAFEAAISQSPSAQDIAIKAAEGHLSEVSIGFFIKEYEEVRDKKTNRTIRHIKEVELVEISLVSRASNPEATILEVREEDLTTSKTNNEQPKEVKMSEENKSEAKEVNPELYEAMLKKMNDLEAQIAKSTKLPEVKEEAAPKAVEFEIKNESELEMFASIVTEKKASKREALEERYMEVKLASNIDADGGLTVPSSMKEKILEKREQLNKMSDLVSKERVSGPISLLDWDFSESFGAHDEGSAVTIEAISDAIGKSILDPQDFSIIVKIPKRLERRAFLDFQNFLAMRYARADRAQLDGHLLTGTGVKQPLGALVFMDDVNSANQVTGVTGGTIVGNLVVGDLIDLEMELAEEYRQNAVFVASPTALKELKKLEDTAGTRVWQRALEAGQPSTLLGYRIIESVSMDAGTSTGDQPILFCDPSMYMLAEEKEFSVEVLRELYAGNDQIGLKFHRAYDGMPVDKNAFASIKIQA